MKTEEFSVLIGLLRQIKEQGDVDDSLSAEIQAAVELLENEGRRGASSDIALKAISLVVAALPEVRELLEMLTEFCG